MTDLTAVARRWLQAGYSVIPVRGDKRAYTEWKPYQVRPYQSEEVDRAFNDPRAKKIAIVCGYGGLFCFDFDPDKEGIAAEPFDLYKDFYEPWRDTAEGAGVDIVAQTTPSSGTHVLMVCPEPIGNQKLARVAATPDDKGKTRTHTAIETRGAGGYFVLYDLELDPNSLPSITNEQFQILLEAAVSLDKAPDAPEVQQAALKQRSGGKQAHAARDGLIGWFNERHTVEQILERNNYRKVLGKYLAPSSTSGNPGVTLFKDSYGYQLCYSHHSDELGDGYAHDAFDTMKMLEFNASFEAALGHVKQLKDQTRFSFGGKTVVSRTPIFAEIIKRKAYQFEFDWDAKTCWLQVDCEDAAERALLLNDHPIFNGALDSLTLLATGPAAQDLMQRYLKYFDGNQLSHVKKIIRKMNEGGNLPLGGRENVSLTPNRENTVTDATTFDVNPLTPNTYLTPNNDDLVSNDEKADTKSRIAVADGEKYKKRKDKNDLVSNDDIKRKPPSPSQKPDLVSNNSQSSKLEAIKKWGDRDRPPPVKWLVHHLVQDNAENLVAGEPGVGKSWISGDLAVSVASGSAFLDRHTEQGPVLIVNFDDPSESLPRMFAERAARGKEYEFGDLPIYYWQPEESRPAPPEGIITLEVFEFLLEQCSLIKPRLIIVDSFSSAFPGLDGNKGPDVLRSFEALRQLRVASGKPSCVLLVDHTPKATLQDSKRRGVSGSQQKHAKTRTVHIIRHVDPGDVNGDDVLEWEVFKANAAPRQESFGVDREMDSLLNTAKLSVRPLPKTGQGAKFDRAAKAAITYLKSRVGEPISRQDLLKEIVAVANVSMETARRGLRSNEFIDHPQIRQVDLGGRGNPAG